MRRRTTAVIAALAVSGVAAMTAGAGTLVKPYVVPVGDEYEVDALLSANDEVDVWGGSGKYRMVGLPDGLGAHSNGNGTATLYMNHELAIKYSNGSDVISEPYVGGTKHRGAFVSKWLLDEDGDPVRGKRAYDKVFLDDVEQLGQDGIGGVALVGNDQPAFARFCSGFLAGPAEGFDRWIYFANEESDAPSTFDAKGGLSVAIFENGGVGEAHGLTALGRFAWENTLVQRNTGDLTVVIGMEDGPAALDPTEANSQLYMYVGKKDPSSSSVLRKNGLVGGTLYVFRSTNKNRPTEVEFRNGTMAGEWIALPSSANSPTTTDVQLEAASDAVGAMTFARPEDGAFNPVNDDEFFFVTTGGDPANTLGRLYSLRLNPSDPTRSATLSVVYNADDVIAGGGDTAISPDNIDASSEYLMINEDGTGASRPVMAANGRDGSIWRWDLKPSGGLHEGSALRIAELDPPGRDNTAIGAGVWETSGIIDTSSIFGRNTWLSVVQAHAPTRAPGGSTTSPYGRDVTVEDGQLFLLRPTT